MHPSLNLLDRAIALAEHEFVLLDTEDCAGLQESADERAEFMHRAWDMKGECPADSFMEKLHELQDLQVRLALKAREKLEETREVLKNSKPAVRAIQGYAHRPRRSELAMMISKTS